MSDGAVHGEVGPFLPCYLVRGDDPALLADAVRRLLGALVGSGDHQLVVEDVELEPGPDGGIGAVLDACLTPPFLTDRRVVVARNAGALGTSEAASLLEYLEAPLATTALVLVAGGGTVPAKLVNRVKALGEVVDAGLPRAGRDRGGWVADRVGDSSVRLDDAAQRVLAQHLGEDLGRLPGILATLEAAFGRDARLTADDVEPFLGEAGAVAPWDLTDAIDRGDTATALEHLHRMLDAGERHPLVVLATLHRHVASMLRLDGSSARNEHEAAELLGLRSAFPAKKAFNQARRLGSAKLRRAIRLVAQADLDLRGARAWPDRLVLEVLVARLCQLSRS